MQSSTGYLVHVYTHVRRSVTSDMRRHRKTLSYSQNGKNPACTRLNWLTIAVFRRTFIYPIASYGYVLAASTYTVIGRRVYRLTTWVFDECGVGSPGVTICHFPVRPRRPPTTQQVAAGTCDDRDLARLIIGTRRCPDGASV